MSNNKFSNIITLTTIFSEKVTEYKMCVLIFSTTFIAHISHSKNNSARYCH
jgi:hypothetical protein